MEIYTLHYFFLQMIPLKTFGLYLMKNSLMWLEFIIAPIVAVLVVFLSLIFAMLINRIGLGWIFGRDSVVFTKR